MCSICDGLKPSLAEIADIERGRQEIYSSDRGDVLLEMIAGCHQRGGFAIISKWIHVMLDPALTPAEMAQWAAPVSLVANLPGLLRVQGGGQAPWKWTDAELLNVIFTALDGLRAHGDEEGARAVACCAGVLVARRRGELGDQAWKGPVRELAVSLRSEYSYETLRALDEEGAIRTGIISRAEIEKAYAGMRVEMN